MTNYDAIPSELQDDQWLLWDSSAETPKRPHWGGDFGVSWSDPDTWHTFEEARDAAQSRESWGIGRVMATGNDDAPDSTYAVIDIDGAVAEDGSLKSWVPELGRFEGTYIERSTSGNGLHIPVDGREIPEWWTDGQLGEHEGVDVLLNKFCIFTGDKIEGSGDTVEPINPSGWLFQAYKQIHDRAPDLGASSAGDDAERGEYLTESDIEDALDHINPDLPHTEWLKVGFAVHDYDSGPTGRQLFEEWSRRGSKYDQSASQSIEWIWSEASEGSGVTLGSLVHKAKEGGWTPPTPAEHGSNGSNPTPDAGKTPLHKAIGPEWFDQERKRVTVERTADYDSSELVDLFAEPDQLPIKATVAIHETDGGDEFLQNPDGWQIEALAPRDPYADLTLQELKNVAVEKIPIERIAWLPKREEWFWCDDDGLWHTHGAEYIRRWLDSEFQEHYRRQLRTEVLDQLKARTRAEEEAFGGGPRGTIATKSGLVNLETGDCREIEPHDRVRWRIESKYDPDANCPRWKEFLGDVVEPADIPLLQEFVGYCLHHWNLPHKKALMLLGPTDAGKSVFIDVVEGLFGGAESPSTSSVAIQYLANERWGPARLVNTAINTRSDLGSELIKNTGKVKELIAGDSLDAERKRKPVFQFKPTAKHIFAANRVPDRNVDDEAFWNRWLTVIFPQSVPKDEQVRNFDQTLLEESAGILNWAIEGYRRLNAQGGFTNEPLPYENRQKWERYGDSIEQFLERYTEIEEGSVVPKRSAGDTLGAYDAYVAFARESGIECESMSKFTSEVTKRGEVIQRKRTVDGSRTRCYVGLSLTDDAPAPQTASSDDAGADADEPGRTGLGAYQ